MDQASAVAERRTRRDWTEAEAREVVAQWEASRLTVAAFAAQQGFNADRFYRWRRRFRRAAGSASAARPRPTLVPLVPVGASASVPPSPTAAPPAGFELVCGGGRVLRIPPGFDAAALAALLRVLAEAAC